MKEFAQLEKQRNQTPGQKTPVGKAGSVGSAPPRSKAASTSQRKTGI